RAEWSARWRQLCAGLDPLAPADEARLADIAAAWTDYLHACKREGLHFIQPGRFVLPGEMAGAPAVESSTLRGLLADQRPPIRPSTL
ncbi:YcjX family protein, partial [Mycobacterium tuberculosis]|nr:YcjX family protein [Mycobacterium tuberculosis]